MQGKVSVAVNAHPTRCIDQLTILRLRQIRHSVPTDECRLSRSRRRRWCICSRHQLSRRCF